MKNTLVLDIGKSNAKLVLIDPRGAVRWSAHCRNAAVEDTRHGFRALGTGRLADWIQQKMTELPQGQAPGRIAITAHGAAFCALGDDGLVLPPIDYEWDGYGDVTAAFDASLANFPHHGTPRLPQGLNAGRQIDFVHRRWPDLAARIRAWLPYPQYWAWWFSGVACTEVSSLGCHTGLWAPGKERFSDWVSARGIATRFAPLRHAWDVIGTLRPSLASAWGLPQGIEVIAGAHDSNACLARYLREHPDAAVVSTGTWCVAMAPGVDITRLAPQRDELVNVAVDGRPVATARFMGGREFAALCNGADPAWATAKALEMVIDEGWMALPSFSDGGGPFMGRRGLVLRHGEPVYRGVAAVPARLRPAWAALYCAQVCAQLVDGLCGTPATSRAVILEGPLADNEAFRAAMAGILAPRSVWRSTDDLEGTARGAWMLAQWSEAPSGPACGQLALVRPLDAAAQDRLRAHVHRWAALVARSA